LRDTVSAVGLQRRVHRNQAPAPDIFAISFAGNSFTSPERVSDFALLRAAELTLNKGDNRFTLLNAARRTLDFLLPAFWQPDFQRLISSAV
jgi:hypothetical protein